MNLKALALTTLAGVTMGTIVTTDAHAFYVGQHCETVTEGGQTARVCATLDATEDVITVRWREGHQIKEAYMRFECVAGELKSWRASRSLGLTKGDAMDYCLDRGTSGLAGAVVNDIFQF